MTGHTTGIGPVRRTNSVTTRSNLSKVGDEETHQEQYTIKDLLHRILLLEQQVTICMNSQPLLHQLAAKSAQLEENLLTMRVEVDGKLNEISNVFQPEEIEVEDMDDQDPLYLQSSTSSEPEFQRYEFEVAPEPAPSPSAAPADFYQPTQTSNAANKTSSSDLKPLQCQLCPLPSEQVFEDEEALTNHYESDHRIANEDDSCGAVQAGDYWWTMDECSSESQCVSAANPSPAAARTMSSMSQERQHSARVRSSNQSKSSIQLNGHVRQHTSPPARPPGSDSDANKSHADHSCPICGQCFPLRRKMTRHLRGVHSDTKYKCEDCGKVYSRKDNFRSHWTRVHGKKMTNSNQSCVSAIEWIQSTKRH